MENTETASGFVGLMGVVLGTLALGVALLHLWAGPIHPQPTLEEVVAEKAVKIRDSVVAKLTGEAQSTPLQDRSFDADRVVTIATVVAGFLAIVLAVVSYIRREDPRVCASAAVLG